MQYFAHKNTVARYVDTQIAFGQHCAYDQYKVEVLISSIKLQL